MPEVTFNFMVNGTDKNPYEKWGFRFNPLPQHGKQELARADLMMQSLAEPIKSADDIRQRLNGCDKDFVERIIATFYKPGEMVKVTLKLHWP